MTEERYLDASKFIRELDEAEREHQLDNDGALEELTKAAVFCGQQAEFHQRRSDEYTLARAAYLAEVHRRVSLPARAGGGQSALKARSGGGFRAWCRANGQNEDYAHSLVGIAKSADPLAKLEKRRAKSRENIIKTRADANAFRQQQIDAHVDPLAGVKREWHKLSPKQREAFLDWVREHDSRTYIASISSLVVRGPAKSFDAPAHQ